MESRLIYEKSKHLLSQVSWEKATDSEWIYCGAMGEVKYDIVGGHFNDFFSTGKIYVSISRKDSFESNKVILLDSIKNMIGLKSFSIWDENFKKVIEFYEIGVFRKGCI